VIVRPADTLEFFARIEKENTRTAYLRAAGQFFAWCEVSGLALPNIQPVHVAAYREVLKKHYAAPIIKQHLAAICRLFDELEVSQVIPHNPAATVRGPKHSTDSVVWFSDMQEP
jgi:site-specific recombinase XerD